MGVLALRGEHLRQAELNAAKLDLPWALFLRESRRGGRKLVVVEYDYFLELYRARYQCGE